MLCDISVFFLGISCIIGRHTWKPWPSSFHCHVFLKIDLQPLLSLTYLSNVGMWGTLLENSGKTTNTTRHCEGLFLVFKIYWNGTLYFYTFWYIITQTLLPKNKGTFFFFFKPALKHKHAFLRIWWMLRFMSGLVIQIGKSFPSANQPVIPQRWVQGHSPVL